MASHGCVIFAKDIQAMSDFYQSVLNMELSVAEQSHHVLNSASLELVIHGIPNHIADNITIESPPQVRGAAAMKPCFAVNSLDAVRTACEQTNGGIKPVADTWDIRGAKVLDGWDPEGNVIQFKQFVS